MNILKQSTRYQLANYRVLLRVATLRLGDKLYEIAALQQPTQFSQNS